MKTIKLTIELDDNNIIHCIHIVENETNLKYFYGMMIEARDYPVSRLTFDDLNEVMSE